MNPSTSIPTHTTPPTKDKQRVMALACLVWAIAVSIAAMIIPPAGVIDSSVLVLIAQIFVLIATLIGISLPSSIHKYVNQDKKV